MMSDGSHHLTIDQFHTFYNQKPEDQDTTLKTEDLR